MLKQNVGVAVFFAVLTLGSFAFVYQEVGFPSVSNASTSAAVDTKVVVTGFVDGVYRGSSDGFGGTLTVEVVIEGGEIANVTVVEHAETAFFFGQASPKVEEAIVAAQSTDVEIVSGATVSSQAIIAATSEALAKAGW